MSHLYPNPFMWMNITYDYGNSFSKEATLPQRLKALPAPFAEPQWNKMEYCIIEIMVPCCPSHHHHSTSFTF